MAGRSSRREAERLLLEGRVRVNGAVVTELGTRVDPGSGQGRGGRGEPSVVGRDTVGRVPQAARACSPRARIPTVATTIYDVLPEPERALRYVGRLDRDTEGLLLLSNEGDVIHASAPPQPGGGAGVRGDGGEGAVARRPSRGCARAWRWTTGPPGRSGPSSVGSVGADGIGAPGPDRGAQARGAPPPRGRGPPGAPPDAGALRARRVGRPCPGGAHGPSPTTRSASCGRSPGRSIDERRDDMDLRDKTVLILGGAGLVGIAVARKMLESRPQRIVIGSLRREESEAALEELRAEPPGRGRRARGGVGRPLRARTP